METMRCNGWCNGCGKPVVWAKDKDSRKMIPLDPEPPVYYLVHATETECIVGRATGVYLAMVSHVVTCPNANECSASEPQEKAT